MTKKLDGKIALVTGGNSGIGLATAKLFKAEGATVIITGRNQERLEAAAREIGDGTIAIKSDTSKLNDISSLFEEIGKRFKKLDILFANAGVATFGPPESVDEATYDHMMDINVKGLFFTVQKALPLLNDGATIVLTSSTASTAGFANTAIYSASKAAVRSLARTLSADLLDRNIRVNAIAPGPIDTPIFGKLGLPEEAIKATKDGFTEMVPMKRFGRPEEVADAVLFLSSDASSYILGEELVVGGGMARL